MFSLSGHDLSTLPPERFLVWDLLRDTDPYYLNHQIFLVDYTAVEELRRNWVEWGFAKPSYVACTLFALSRVLQHHPLFNSYLREFPWVRLARYHGIDIAYTVEKPRTDGSPTLTLSVLRECGGLRFFDFCERLRLDKEAALEELGYHRTRRCFALIPNFLRMILFRLFCKPFPGIMRQIAGTVGFTSVGKDGVDFTTPLSPKTLTLSLGAVKERPMVRDGQVESRLSAYVTVTYDHRVADGRDCARFGQELRAFLEDEITTVVVESGKEATC